jgi:hypothetical protein
MLNIINGIIFLPTREEEFERIKDELNKIQHTQMKTINESNSSEKSAEANTTKINNQDDDLQ